MKRRFDALKTQLARRNLYSGEGSPTSQPQYSIIRKLHRLFGLYPCIHAKHFYYERANSFMAPKIYEFVKMLKLTTLKKTDTILDLGCGEGTLSLILGSKVKKVVGVDTNSASIEDARFKAKELSEQVNATFYDQLLEELRFDDSSFDKIFSFSVIEHIANYEEIFAETFRILKKGGELIISVDSFPHFDPQLKSRHQDLFDVQKYFEKNELTSFLQELRFRNVEVIPIFKSDFSRNWFERVIKNHNENFDFHKRFYSLYVYFLIVLNEKFTKRSTSNGIFLLARCVK